MRGFYAEGFVQPVCLRGDAAGACMLAQASSADEVAEKLKTLPLVQAGFLQAPMIVPLKPYLGFAPRPDEWAGFAARVNHASWKEAPYEMDRFLGAYRCDGGRRCRLHSLRIWRR